MAPEPGQEAIYQQPNVTFLQLRERLTTTTSTELERQTVKGRSLKKQNEAILLHPDQVPGLHFLPEQTLTPS